MGLMHKRILVLFAFSLSTLFYMMLATNPSSCGPLGVLLFFTTLYAFLFSLSFIFVRIFRRIKNGKTNDTSYRKDYAYSLVIGFSPIIFLLINNFGLGYVVSIFGALIFLFLGCFLVKNRYSVIK